MKSAINSFLAGCGVPFGCAVGCGVLLVLTFMLVVYSLTR